MNKQSCMQVLRRLISMGVFLAIVTSLPAVAGDVHALFNLVDPAVGPFPSDQFTVPDPSQITGRRVALPKPDCSKQPSDCDDIAIINTLDGFNLQPRIAISFDGAIDASSVTSKSVSLVEFGNPAPPRIIGINQIVWDPATKTLYVTSDEALDQHAQFALIATQGILDPQGKPAQASAEFTQFINSGTGDYRDRLRAGLDAAASLGIPRDTVVTASVFTTLSATAILEKIRDQIHAAIPKPASFVTDGVRTVFPRSTVSSIVVHQQTKVSPPGFTDAAVNLNLLDQVPGSVGAIAFGTFLSPDYQTVQKVIPAVGTLTGDPAVQGTNTLVFDLILPTGPKPAKGWPVAILGPGNPDSKERVFNVGSIMAEHGFATICTNIVANGFGSLSTLDVNLSNGQTVTFPAGGRSVDMDGNNVIQNNEGFKTVGPPYAIITIRDGVRQTAADLMQLIRVIQVGMDVDGDGQADLDASRIYYFGASQGGIYGIALLAVEAGIRAGAPSFFGGPQAERQRAGANRANEGALLQQRIPSLLNSPGVTQIGGLPVLPPFFNENKPLRNLPPVINDVAGAMDIQQFFDHEDWVSQPASAVANAPYIRKTPLAGMTAKPVIFLLAKGDQTVPVPFGTAVVRSGDLADVTTYFRNDLAYAQNPNVPKNSHYFYFSIDDPTIVGAASGAQEQIATFFESDGARIIHPEPAELFEFPIKLPLPENIEYITNAPPAQPPVDAATYQTALSPGTLFSIFGATSAIAEKQAGAGSLPTSLGGIMVTVNGKAAPLLYVGPNQINGQVPYETVIDGAIAQVIANGISTAQLPFAVSSMAPRIFSGQGNVCIAQNEDGTLNSASNPVKTGHNVVAYLIGLGAVNPAVATGAPAPAAPLSSPLGPATALLGGRSLIPIYLGLTPGFVGVGEVKVLVPSDVPDGLQNFAVTVGGATSNTCLIAVAK